MKWVLENVAIRRLHVISQSNYFYPHVIIAIGCREPIGRVLLDANKKAAEFCPNLFSRPTVSVMSLKGMDSDCDVKRVYKFAQICS